MSVTASSEWQSLRSDADFDLATKRRADQRDDIMALRFRKSFKFAPGVRWNLSLAGPSVSAGPRGASVSVGKRGTYLNSSIPGTALSSRTKLGGGSSSPTAASHRLAEHSPAVTSDGAGQPVPEHLVELSKKQNKAAILGLIQQKCDEINGDVDALGRLHHDTLDPRNKPSFVAAPFLLAPPGAPELKKATFFQGLTKRGREAVAIANNEATEEYRKAMAAWEARKAAHEQAQAKARRLVEVDILADTAAMEQHLEQSLLDIGWPRETAVAFEVRDSGAKVLLDVDLPEVEDMPTKTASVPSRGLKLTVKDIPATKVQKLYLEHVHGIVFRLVGEVFASLPTARTVVVSGYTQRASSATGQLQDEYVVSVRVERTKWQEMDFARLCDIDVVEALGRYDIVRKPERSGKLLAIAPFSE